jgi:hypothetical protein
VYSLGAIAHELLTGRRPLGSGEPEESTLLHRVLAKAMAANPDDRFASARAFIDALDAVANRALDSMEAGSLDPAVVVPGSEDPGLNVPDHLPDEIAEPVALVPPDEVVEDELPLVHASSHVDPAVESVDLLDRAEPDEPIEEPKLEAPAIEPPRPAAPRVLGPPEPPRPEPGKPLWAPFMTQALSSASDMDGAPRYRYPWVGMAAVLLAGIALGATGMHIYHRVGEPTVTAGLPPPPSPADAPPARAETEVQVAPQTPPPATADSPPPAAPGSVTAQAPSPAAAVAPPASSRPEAPVRAASVTGRLVIRSAPSGALVTIDGRRQGETPVTLRDLPLGSHSVQIARRGYVPETRKVTLTSRAPAQTVSVSLKAGAAQAASASAPAASATTGSIYADTRPRAARVVIDGKPYGMTPVLVPQLSPGTHTVRLEMDGYAPSSTSVTVRAGEQSRVSVSLVRR